MGKMTCVNGESLVCMDSKGKLTSVDTCMTPPFCVPIPYANLGESLLADLTVKSIKMGGMPVCNMKSTFKITTGDAPGVCAGVASGSIGQIAQFKQGSKTVKFCGEDAVTNGHLMTANMDNTGPQPLMQPPCQPPPAGTTAAPEKLEIKEFSQQFDFSNLIGFAPGEQVILERPYYEIWIKEGERICNGNLSNKGLTERAFTSEKKELVVWLGEGEWRIFGEFEHGPYENYAENQLNLETATIGLVFFSFAWAHLTELDYKLVAGDKTVTGKTDSVGSAQILKDVKPGTQVEVWVQQDRTKEYKKIGSIDAFAGETHYSVVSAKIKVEAPTEAHLNKPAAAKVEAPKTTTKPAEIKAPPQKTAAEVSLNATNNPMAKLPQDIVLPLVSMGALGALIFVTWNYFKSSRQVGGNPKISPATMPSQAKTGTSFSTDNLAKLKKLISFAERQVKFNYRAYKNAHGHKATLDVLREYETAYASDPNALPAFGEGGKKEATNFNGYCLGYVKFALIHTNMINGFPEAVLAKNSVADWPKFGYTDVSASLPEVEITYEKAYAEEDVPKVEKILEKEARVKQLHKELEKLNGKLKTAKHSKEPEKITAAETDIAGKKTEITSAEDELATAKKKAPDRQAVKYTQRDLMYTLPGDLIVYAMVDPVEINAPGHIDIRTYHGYVADAIRPQPLPALGFSSRSRYRVIGVFRKISDTMAMARVQAFLRIIREHEAKGFKDPYHALKFDITRKPDPFITFDDLSTHPSNGKDKKPAGAYQIKYNTWDEVCNATGWPRTFTKDMQDRFAMYLLQQRPFDNTNKPNIRRSALGYIMEGNVEKAVNELKLWNLFAFLPGGGKQQQMTMSELQTDFEKYIKEYSK